MADIAARMGLSLRTLERYTAENVDIDRAIKKGREVYAIMQCDAIESGLDWLCSAHWLEESERWENTDDAGRTSISIRTKRKQVDPNVTALIFKAKKLMPDKYGDETVSNKEERTIDPLSAALYEYERQAAEQMKGEQNNTDS